MPARLRLRKRWLILFALLGLLLFAGWWIHRALDPQRLAPWLLREAGIALGLEIDFQGQPDYALRPEPRLRLDNVSVRGRGDSTLLLRAQRLEISLPWSTLKGDAGPVTITRLQLQSPELDLSALRRWQASRPAAPFELPQLTDGLQISAGRVRDDAWTLSDLDLQLPRLVTGSPAELNGSARLDHGEHRFDLDMRLEIDKVAAHSAIQLELRGQWHRGTRVLPLSLNMRGLLDVAETQQVLQSELLEFDSESPLPDFIGSLALVRDDQLDLQLRGRLPEWPADWPALPIPATTSPLQVEFAYQGPETFDGIARIALVRDNVSAKADFKIPELRAWLDASERPLLPPLRFEASLPRVDIDGVQMDDVRIEVSEPVADEAGARPATEVEKSP